MKVLFKKGLTLSFLLLSLFLNSSVCFAFFDCDFYSIPVSSKQSEIEVGMEVTPSIQLSVYPEDISFSNKESIYCVAENCFVNNSYKRIVHRFDLLFEFFSLPPPLV
ncbi:MAG: hypothetical protein SFU98_18330 [Leptospiraceae bacterium]|nr:hypothetical protein [Leptospiraceae bacterium]